MDKTVLELVNVTKTFHKNTPNEHTALRNINLTLEEGDFVTIIGSNGAGKSTLFNAICGSFPIDSGKICLRGKTINNLPDFKRAYTIGRLHQDPMKGTAPNMTVEENLSLAYTRQAKKSFFAVNKQDSKKFKELLSMLDLGLENRLKTKIGLLSGGQRQAVSLLMATITKPQLLLLDEHTASLDPQTAKQVLAITKRLVRESNIATMMITHDIKAALEIGNATIMMDDGRIILDIKGHKRKDMTVDELLSLYSKESKKELLNDRMLFQLKKDETSQQ